MRGAHRPGSVLAFALAVSWLTLGEGVHTQSSTTNPYRASFGWEQLPAGRVMGTVSGVFPDPDGRHLWILDRCGANQCAGTDLDPIMKFDLDGNLVDSFGAGLFAFPHGFFLDHEGFLWVTEGGSHGDARATLGESMGLGHQVLKLNQRGEVVMRLGEGGVWGDGPDRFNGPSGVVVAPNGDIWVSDGHRGGNNRIVKFSSDGTFLLGVGGGVGSESKEAARFSDPHDIKMDSEGRVYVADRGNSRIQIFDPDGMLLAIWTHYGKPSGLFIDRNDILYAGDGLSGMVRTGAPDPWRSNLGWEKGIRIGDLKTEQAWVTHFIPHHETDVWAGIEFLGVDFDGNIYAGEVSRRRLVRYVPFRPPEVRCLMMRARHLGGSLLCLAVACAPDGGPPPPAGNAFWFEGARLIVGDGGALIEDAAFLVEEGTFTWVGRRDEMEPPDDVQRIDLDGKVVIPALIDAHQHIGLTNVRDGTSSTDNYTRANLIEHLERSAYHGVAVTMSLGLEFDEPLAFELRHETLPHAARFLTSGRGIAGTPMAGPQQEYRQGIPRGALTEAEGRAAVQELRAADVDLVKVWVDDRGGTVPKLEPNVYRAIINEAHANGMRVVAHVGTTSALEDAKELLRAGVDGFAHTVRDRDVDAAYLELVRQHPEVWTIPNLPGSPVTMDDLPWLSETLPPFEVENLRQQIDRREAAGPPGPEEQFPLQCRNLAKNHAAGMVIGMGTDSGTSVAWTTHTELRDMVTCGLSPMEAIVAATRTNADILGLDQLGMVAAGKSASFVVLDGNPLEDINNTRRISQVYLHGEPVDREALRTKFMDGVM